MSNATNTTRPGLGVMLSIFSGSTNRTENAIKLCLGKTIAGIRKDGDTLKFQFDDGTLLDLWDDGQSCCESRYLTCDDKADFDQWKGAKLVKIETVPGPDIDGGSEHHETEFLNVETDRGLIQCVSHNEHNGYYGGFSVVAKCTLPDGRDGASVVADAIEAEKIADAARKAAGKLEDAAKNYRMKAKAEISMTDQYVLKPAGLTKEIVASAVKRIRQECDAPFNLSEKLNNIRTICDALDGLNK